MNKVVAIVDRFRERAALNLAFVGMTAVLGFLAWLGSSHLQNQLRQIAEYTAEREWMLEQEGELRATSVALHERLTSVKAVLDTLQAKLPPIPEESQFLHELSQLAAESGVSLSEFRPGGVTKRPNCKEIDLRMRGTGEYASVCRWLDSLDDVPRFVRIANITFSGPSTPGGDCIVDVELDLLFGLEAPPQLAAAVKP